MIVIYVLLILMFLYVINRMSDMLIEVINYKLKEREEQERQQHDCQYCYHYKDGKCHTQFEQDCKDNNFFVWYPKDEDK